MFILGDDGLFAAQDAFQLYDIVFIALYQLYEARLFESG